MSEEASGAKVPETAEWFLAVRGEKLGPVSWEEMKELVRLDGLDPRKDMAWKAGMEEWQPAGEIEGLFERRAPEEVEETPGMAVTATTAEAAGEGEGGGVWENEEEDPYFHHELTEPWPGVGRLGYFMAVAVLPVLGSFLLVVLQRMVASMAGEEIAQYVPLLSVVFVIISLYATVTRFPNLGMSRWWFFGLIVPVLNWWLGYRLFACPPGYAYNKRLDGIGWVLAILYWLMIVVELIAVAMIVMMILKGGFDVEAFIRALENSGAGK